MCAKGKSRLEPVGSAVRWNLDRYETDVAQPGRPDLLLAAPRNFASRFRNCSSHGQLALRNLMLPPSGGIDAQTMTTAEVQSMKSHTKKPKIKTHLVLEERIKMPVRATRTYRQCLVADPSRVFPLLCPVRETDWIEGWAPLSVITESGVAEQDCVFVTSAMPSDAIWYITRHEPANGFVEMLKITPQVTACRLSIQLRSVPTGSEATITYSHTSLGQEGDAFVEAFTEEYYAQFMRDWENRLNHYLIHGSILPGAHG